MDGFPILSFITYAPAVGAAIIFFWPRATKNATRWIAMIASIVSLILSLVMIGSFNIHHSGMQFQEHAKWLPNVGISYFMGVDGISALLIVLTTILSTIAIL
ncbi:MAG TPA: NADH-quinone oxidoreductase subunit M, partial [Thermomicrobiaceae bacterium]|nr:NADH-quinone oxidoreductase subunit M [Thermomicrobiaceae bacterium]